MAETQTQSTSQPAGSTTNPGHGFPDPSITLVEFGEALGILIAGVTERDMANRRIVLKKVGYVRLEAKSWGLALYPEVWVHQTEDGLFIATDPRTGRTFRHPSRRRYEIAFISKEIFDCSIQCLKEKRPAPLYELVAVTFGTRKDFSVESGCLMAPDDYAAEVSAHVPAGFVEPPPPMG